MGVVLPIDPVKITQVFGVNSANYAQFGLKGHNGWDLKTKWSDTPDGKRKLFATFDCTFHKVGNEGSKGYGKYTEHITRPGNRIFKHTYAHCDNTPTFSTKEQGEDLAISDNTGNSTGAHLHWTVKELDSAGNIINYNNGYFGAINPQVYLDYVRSLPDTQPTPMDKRPYWFDLMNKVIWNKPHEQLTDAQINSFTKEYPTQLSRSGKWDQICKKAGFAGDTNLITVDMLYDKLHTGVNKKELLDAVIAKVKELY